MGNCRKNVKIKNLLSKEEEMAIDNEFNFFFAKEKTDNLCELSDNKKINEIFLDNKLKEIS